MKRIRSAAPPRNDDGPGIYPWALVVMACAVCLPLFRTGVVVPGNELAGLEPWMVPAGSRAINVLLHALTCVIVYQLGRLLLGGTTAALWAALFFAVHPVHVDAVARAAGTAELIAALFIFGFLLLVLRMSGAASNEALREALLLSTAIVWLASRGTAWYATARQHCPENPLLAEPAWTRFMTGVSVLGRCLELLVWPYRLSPDYSYNSVAAVTGAMSPAFIVPLVCVVALFVLAAIRAWQGQAFYLICALFLMICAFPLWGTGKPVMAERWLYFPSAAFCWMASLLFRDAGLLPRLNWRDSRFVKSAALLVLVLALPWGIKTYIRSLQWRDEKTLLQRAAVTVPGNAFIQLLLGEHYEREGDYSAAAKFYRRASEINPDCTEAGLKLAGAYRNTGMFDEALATARQVAPSGPEGRALRAAEIARVYVATEDYPRAARAFEESLANSQMDAAVHRELGMLYLHLLGDPGRGRSHLRRSLEIDPAQTSGPAIRELLARP